MDIMGKYKTYREVGMELNYKIVTSCLKREALMKSARLLGIARGDTLIFDSDEEMSILMDFALNEYRKDNKNTIEIYREKTGWQNETEKDILDALLSSYTSLFKITSISEAENTLLLNDILNKKGNIELIDIALSETATPELLLFIRLVPVKDFNMTSGIVFAFPGDSKEYLFMKYRELSKKVKSDSETARRFISFFRLSKTDGIEVSERRTF